MRRRYALLIAFFLALPVSIHAQALIITFTSHTNHSWVIRYRTNSYGLEQSTFFWGGINPADTYTTFHLGTFTRSFHCTIWPVAAALIAAPACLLWLILYGFGFAAKSREKPTLPDPNPPP